ncbi:DEKNAAC101845 [Brettanomyces naardenensis]|uniref:Signal recognition particle receptor subunit alpha homolog n=1 Tax=Brettanomyces naardenensis TaxID=13370 RepID=A0A448YJ50_BRENA|nr:DEKNAAC101845 [Brettanomyces naardenensis]
MIEQFLIFKPSGVVEFNYQPGKNLVSIANSFIEDVVISERKFIPVEGTEEELERDAEDLAAQEEKLSIEQAIGEEEDDLIFGTFAKDSYSLKYLIWTQDKERLFFVMIYPTLLTVKKPYEFLRNVKTLWEKTEDREKFSIFFRLKVEGIQEEIRDDEVEEDIVGENVEATVKSELDGNSTKKAKKSKKGGKKSRKWNEDGSFYEEEKGDNKTLDFSTSKENSKQSPVNLEQLVGDKAHFGSKTKSGEFLVSDLSEEMDRILKSDEEKKKKVVSTGATSSPFGFLRNVIGGKKIQKEDVSKVKSVLSQHLIKKNVAPNVANSLISEIEKELVGSTTASFTSVEETARKSLERQLIKLLTPNSSIDLLNEIQEKVGNKEGPYVISVVGVNGVGKSTNLSKLAYWFLQNNYRVLITACDTFRSGAVEQLRTHVNNLSNLSPEKHQIELFEGGYGGSDLVAKIATGAIVYAKQHNFDIVLLDTAGRRHNDAHLMTPLASFARAANPDKIIMVGEALVGTDSVLQAKNFDKAFGANRRLDFFIVSKCDTVGDMIGSMVNMVFATGIPILFVGTGQTYTDLRTLSVNWAVNTLMS